MSKENQNAENTSANAQDTTNTGDNTSLLGGENTNNTNGTQKTEGTDTQDKQDGNASNEPVNYEFNLPEDFEAPEGAVEELKGLLNKSKVAKENAQGIVDFYLKLRTQESQKAEKMISDYKASLIAKTKADSEIGGVKLQENLESTKKAIVKFGGKELLDRLIETGLDCDPVILKAFFRVSKSISEGAYYEGGVPKVDGIKRTATGEPILNFDEKK